MDRTQEQEMSRLRFSIANIFLDLKLLKLSLRLKAGFRPDQSRVPAGSPDGGQWTDEEGDARLLFVNRRSPRGTGQVRINGNWHAATPAQEARLAASLGEMQAALRAVRKVDPKWKPTPQAYATVEGYIRANEQTTRDAQFRIFELSRSKVGPGPFAKWMGFSAAHQPALDPRGAGRNQSSGTEVRLPPMWYLQPWNTKRKFRGRPSNVEEPGKTYSNLSSLHSL